MIIDLDRETPALAEPHFDVCIAGAGVAGILVSLKLAGLGRRVLLIEAGGIAPTVGSQEFYRGSNTGTENLLLHETRLRALGGSSNHWGGWCRPFDPEDFARSDYDPDGSWPISAADLAPYAKDAISALAVTRAAGADLDLVGSDGNLRSIRMMFSAPPAALGQHYGPTIERTDRIALLLHGTVTQAAFNRESGSIEGMTVANAARQAALQATADAFVLAMGAVDNVRSLLIWNRELGNRLGNESGALGRYYMQHLHQQAGQFLLLNGGAAGPDDEPEAEPRAFFATTSRFARERGIGAARLYSTGISCDALLDRFRSVAVAAECSAIVAGRTLFVTAEQRPNSASRIALIDETDPLGRPRVELDWQTGPDDTRTLLEAALEFGRYLVRADLGRLKVDGRLLAGDRPLDGWTDLPSAPGAAGHQLGGARMSATAADGIVDRDCRVWGTRNLYVAGSAVFRTGSQATPTFTIAQLALRLADHLGRILRP